MSEPITIHLSVGSAPQGIHASIDIPIDTPPEEMNARIDAFLDIWGRTQLARKRIGL